MTDHRVDRFREWVGKSGDGRYARKMAREMLMVSTVETDSAGGVRTVSGPVVEGDGTLSQATFTVPMRGRTAAVGEFLWVGREADQVAGAELVYLDHAESPYPGAGLITVDGNLPAPTGITISSTLVVLPGSITARATVNFTAVGDRYQPSGYTVSFRVDGGEWSDRHVPHLGGVQECVIGSDLPPGSTLDVHIRTKSGWSGVESVPSADVTDTLAADTSSAGTVTALAYDVTVPNQVMITPTVTINPALFRGIQYEINDAASGLPDITTVPVADPGPYALVLPPGTYYAAARTVSKSGTLGTRYPSSGFNGPFTILDQSANLDTVAPSGMGAPTLATRTLQAADGAWHGFLTVTRPTYSPPADIAYYEISIVCSDGRAWVEQIPSSMTVWDGEVGFGTFTVSMRAVDHAGNRPAFGTTAGASIPAPALSSSTPTVTTASIGAGIKVVWSAIDGALAWEVYRATSSGGAGATLVATTDARVYIDPLISDTLILPQYWYRVRALSVSNGSVIQGTYSAWTSGTAGAIDGQNLRALSIVAGLIAANAITAAKLEADLIMVSKIRSASSGARFEIEGATTGGGSAPAQFRFYDATNQTALFDGSGLYFYGTGGQGDFSLARNGSGRGQLTMGALTVGTDGVGPFVSIPVSSSGAAGEVRFSGSVSNTKLREISYTGLNALGVVKGHGTIGDPILILYDNVGGGGGSDQLILTMAGMIVDSAAISPANFLYHNSRYWDSNIPILATEMHAGSLPSHVASYLHTVHQSSALGTTAADVQTIAAWSYPSTSQMTARMRAYRGQNGSGRTDARFRLDSDYNNETNLGGGIMWGFRGTDPLVGLSINGTTLKLFWDHTNTRWSIPDGLSITGALSKGSGTFDIPHPDPSKADTHRLRHGFVESPTRGDNLYRFAVLVSPEQVGQEVETLLPDYWPWLNECPQCWCSPRRHFGQAWADVALDGQTFTLAANGAGWYNVLIIGTRKDAIAVAGWDNTGGIEPLALPAHDDAP